MTHAPLHMRSVSMRRVWAMPSHETFSIAPISDLLDELLSECETIIDPFARNSTRGTVRNDLNPTTAAEHHLPADAFATMLLDRGERADAVLFDPPYSPRQIKECYESTGIEVGQCETQHAGLVARTKNNLGAIVRIGGIAICCGWNSSGFGINRGFAMERILLVNHGGSHNDTIVTVERKISGGLFDSCPPPHAAPEGEGATHA